MSNGSGSPLLKNATRRVPKTTYVPLNISVPDSVVGRAVIKSYYIQQLTLQPGETAAVKAQLAAGGSASALPWKTLQQFEGPRLPSQLPSSSAFAKVPSAALLAFGKTVLALRQKSLSQLQQQTGGAVPVPGAVARAGRRRVAAAGPPISPPIFQDVGIGMSLVNAAIGAVSAFEANVAATPIGMLNLERLEMTPAGIERGELLATIPLAPKEQTAVVHKEWSVTTKEFTSIVTDSLENYSETGVTENTDLSQSTTSQAQHSNQLNINSTVSGGYAPFVSASISAGFSSQDSNSQSATNSRKDAIQMTRKASARVKQEHKTTISITTVTGASESSTRILQNPSDTNPMRVDYFSLMRKWRVQLYRYGLRLTYDVAIPEPGAALREAYMNLDDLQSQAAQTFSFPVSPSDLDATNWQLYAAQYQATLSPPPLTANEMSFTSSYSVPAGQDNGFTFTTMELDLPAGYVVSSGTLTASQAAGSDRNFPIPFLHVMLVGDVAVSGPVSDSTVSLDYLNGRSDKQYVTYGVSESLSGAIEVDVQLQDAGALAAWQEQAWQTLYNAAQTAFYASQQAINSQIQMLQDKINNVDTLTLRREENEEIMKGVLRWLLGPSFDFMPADVVKLFGEAGPSVSCVPDHQPDACDLIMHGVSFTGNDLFSGNPKLSADKWSTMFGYQEMVKFINGAIEWENVLYFLYSYFWDVPVSWEFIRQIQHPDATRQAFLRAGSARVVLTVRKGWEDDWITFVEAGGFDKTLLKNHPYLTIADEIKDYDSTNYPGIPPADPDSGATLTDADSVATTSNAKAGPSAGPVTIPVDSSDGFVVGYDAVIDAYDNGTTVQGQFQTLQELQRIVAVSAGPPPTITVAALGNAHDGTLGSPAKIAPFPVLQPGEKGQLIAQWYEYTPTPGTDIAVTIAGVTRPTDPNLGSIA